MLTSLFLFLSFFVPAVPPGVVIDHEAAGTVTVYRIAFDRGAPGWQLTWHSHDLFGPQSDQGEFRYYASFQVDRSRAMVAQGGGVKEQFWSNLFVRGGFVYLMGTNHEYGRIVIRRLPAKAKTQESSGARRRT